MRSPTQSHDAAAVQLRALPILGLAATVALGTALGLWMVHAAALPQAPAVEAHVAGGAHGADGHDAAEPADTVEAHGSDAHASHGAHAGAVPMPGTALPSTAPPDPAPADPAPADPAPTADVVAARPVGPTLAGFGLVNLLVVLAALLVGRRRSRPAGRAS